MEAKGRTIMSCEYCNKEYGIYHKRNGYMLIEHNFCPMCGKPLKDPEPLTLEELKERDGKPVYCVGLDNNCFNGWCLVNICEKKVVDSEGDYWEMVKYGKLFVCYDREPKED